MLQLIHSDNSLFFANHVGTGTGTYQYVVFLHRATESILCLVFFRFKFSSVFVKEICKQI